MTNSNEKTEEKGKKNERELALQILLDILKDGGYNNILLNKTLSNNTLLSQVEKSFITELVNGTLRNLGKIDYIINQFSNTKTTKQKPMILSILRLGVYQIMFLDKVPDSAACNECVNLAKKKGFQNLGGFVNGVLRNIIRNKENIKYPDKANFVEYYSVMYSYPTWLIEYWLKDHNKEEVERICIGNNAVPKVTVCVNTLLITREELVKELEKEGVEVTVSSRMEHALYLKQTSNMKNLQTYKKGFFHVMDEGAMLASYVLNVKENETVMDLCAAPGGKSFYMSYIMKDTGKINSYDIYEHKIELMNEGVKRLHITNIETEISDATKLMKIKTNKTHKVDKILLDVPCSGFGLLRKKPDIKYGKTHEDIRELAMIQRKILENGSRYLKDDGELVYSTCTLSVAENIENVKHFASEHGFELIDLSSYIENFDSCIKKGKCIEVLPSSDNDGFFIAKLRKTKKV